MAKRCEYNNCPEQVVKEYEGKGYCWNHYTKILPIFDKLFKKIFGYYL